MTKLYIYITAPEAFLAGDFFLSMRITSKNEWHDKAGIPFLTSVDIDLENIDRADIVNKAVTALDAEAKTIRAEAEAKATDIERRKQELLSITHNPSPSNFVVETGYADAAPNINQEDL